MLKVKKESVLYEHRDYEAVADDPLSNTFDRGERLKHYIRQLWVKCGTAPLINYQKCNVCEKLSPNIIMIKQP